MGDEDVEQGVAEDAADEALEPGGEADGDARDGTPGGAFEFEAAADDAGKRLDVVLVRHVPGMSRSRARELAAGGRVRVDGRIARKGAPVRGGAKIVLAELPRARDFAAAPDASLELVLLHEDRWVVVVEKPARVPTHPLREGELSTVAGALVARYPEMASVGYARREPGILHRLDTDTSGVLLAARDAATFDTLRAALKQGEIEKRYKALCVGAVDAPQTVSYPLAPHPKDRRRVLACVHERDVARNAPRPAVSEIVSAEAAGDMSLVEVIARTAGRHQIRAHMSALGHALAGDPLYDGPSVPGLGRHFLHASEIAFVCPGTGRPLRIRSALPAELAAALDTVRSSA